MFNRLFVNSLKILFKNKSLVFWTFVFPILLGTFFNMAFSNIENEEKLSVIDIGVVYDDNFKSDVILDTSLKYLGNVDDENRLFNIFYGSLDENKDKLEDNSIVGYLYIDNGAHVVIEKNGIDQSIFKYVIEEISYLPKDFNYDDIELINREVKVNNLTSEHMSYTMIEFYSLIAMTCLYGAILSMYSLNQILPNMSNKGKRVSISPVPKLKLILSSLLSSYVVQVIGVLLLFIYTIFVLKVDYGNNLLLVILLTLVGSLAGLSLGVFVSTIFKSNENTKMGIIISITMLFSFFAGMMGITMKYTIDKNIPVLNMINPVNMITDGLYSLYYYDTLNRYLMNLISLILFSFILIIVSFIFLRREKYDSI